MKNPLVYVALQQFCELDQHPRRLLEEAGFRLQWNRLGRRLLGEEIPDLLKDAEAVLAGVEPYDAETFRRLPQLRFISRCGTGTDSIDLEAARRHNVAVLTTPEEVVEAVAQLALGMILGLARNFPLHLSDFRQGLWRKHPGFLLSEWTIGIIGFGQIGRTLERTLRPFGCAILVADPAVKADSLPEGVRLAPLEDLLSRSDLVSLHLTRRPEEGPLIDRREISWMKRGSYLVNTSRGHLVSESALLEALESGHLKGAALDVFEREPYQGPLSRHPQVLATPHIASLTHRSRIQMELRCARNVVEFFTHG